MFSIEISPKSIISLHVYFLRNSHVLQTFIQIWHSISFTADRSESNYARNLLLFCKVDISVRYFHPMTWHVEKMINFSKRYHIPQCNTYWFQVGKIRKFKYINILIEFFSERTSSISRNVNLKGRGNLFSFPLRTPCMTYASYE